MDARRAYRSCAVALAATLSACGLMQSSSGPEHRAGESLDAFIQKRRLAEGSGLSARMPVDPTASQRGNGGSRQSALEQLLEKGYSRAEALTSLAALRVEQWRCIEAETLLLQIPKEAAEKDRDRRTFLMGKALRRQGRAKEAYAMLAPLSKRSGPFQVKAIYYSIHVLRELGRFDDALLQFEVLKRPEFAEDVKGLGSRYIQWLADALAAEIKAGRRIPQFSEELEIILRTSEDVEFRRRAVRALGLAKKPSMYLLEYVLRFDDEMSIRLLAMSIMLRVDPEPWKTLVVGLGDREPSLRRKAASLFESPLIPKDIALPRLFAAFEIEEDSATFRQIHDSLQAVAGRLHIFVAGSEDKQEERVRLRENWRKYLDFPKLQRTKKAAGKAKERLP